MQLVTPITIKEKDQDPDAVNTLFLIDIMHMREINEVYGYKNGNGVLHQFSSLFITKIIPKVEKLLKKFKIENSDIVFKNQYVDIFSLKLFCELDERIILKLKNIIFEMLVNKQFDILEHNLKINIDVTIGCSQGRNSDLMIYAEKALYNAKENYEPYSYCDDTLSESSLLNKSLLEIMRYNIDEKKVQPFFQEIVDNKKGSSHKYEALMRLMDKQNNILSPNAFMDKAKKFRLYPQLMEVMIEKVFDIIAEHKIYASINLDYHDFINPNIKSFILNSLQSKKIGKYLTVEILESEKIHDFDKVNEFIAELREYNVLVAIDDFGSGFANYEHILQLDVDYIKLDGSLVKRINEQIYYDLIKSIVSFCRKQNIKVIAEFVSSLAILRYVKSLKIDYSQGYYIAKPKPIQKIISDKKGKK